MVVSRKIKYNCWYNSEGSFSRLSGPSDKNCYFVNDMDHSLYHILGNYTFGINSKWFDSFKGTYYKEF